MAMKKVNKKVVAKSKVKAAVNLETKLLLSIMMGVAFSATLFSFVAFSQGLEKSKAKPVAKKVTVSQPVAYEGAATRVVTVDDWGINELNNPIDDWGVDTLPGEAETGIVFVTDMSGSVEDLLPQVKTGMLLALNNIFNMATSTMATSTVEVALVSYGETVVTDSNFTNNYDDLRSVVNNYSGHLGMTDHSLGLERAYQLLLSRDYERNIVIFMTDGEATTGPNGICEGGYNSSNDYARSLCIAENNLKACNSTDDVCADVYTIAATSHSGLRGFMNAISSSECSYIDYGFTASPGMCGSNGVECHNADQQFEECDEASMNCYQCQWTGNKLYENRAYDDASGLYMAYHYLSSRLVLPPTCGDGVCNSEEACNTCRADCGTCPKPGTHFERMEDIVPE